MFQCHIFLSSMSHTKDSVFSFELLFLWFHCCEEPHQSQSLFLHQHSPRSWTEHASISFMSLVLENLWILVGSWYILSKVFVIKAKTFFMGPKRVFLISVASTDDAKWWVPHKFISNANSCKHLSELIVVIIFLSIKYKYLKLLDLPLILENDDGDDDDNDDNNSSSVLKAVLC